MHPSDSCATMSNVVSYKSLQFVTNLVLGARSEGHGTTKLPGIIKHNSEQAKIINMIKSGAM